MYVNIQISPFKVSESLQTRRGHSTTATRVGLKLTEAVIFGGLSGFPVVRRDLLADTTILQFSEWSEVYSVHVVKRKQGRGEIKLIWTKLTRVHVGEVLALSFIKNTQFLRHSNPCVPFGREEGRK